MDANGWRPINEAPKDGSRFLAGWFAQLRMNGAKHWVELIMRYKDNPYEDGIQDIVSCPGDWQYAPTHFMPLPPPPAQEVKCRPKECRCDPREMECRCGYEEQEVK